MTDYLDSANELLIYSSNKNEVIKEISNLFIFLLRDSYMQKYEEKST